jgi:hypothetical protein
MTLTFVMSETPDAAAVGKYQVQLAKLKPSCTRCGKNVPPKLAAMTTASTRVCADRDACTLRAILRHSPKNGYRS